VIYDRDALDVCFTSHASRFAIHFRTSRWAIALACQGILIGPLPKRFLHRHLARDAMMGHGIANSSQSCFVVGSDVSLARCSQASAFIRYVSLRFLIGM
jgi:hypothetical protein